MKQITSIILLLAASTTLAQQTGSIAGKLTDKDYNDEPLPFANVIIKGTSKGTTSDFDGFYELDNMEPGSYTVQFSYVGYETVEIEATVTANNITTVNAILGASAATLDQVVITTTTKKESAVALLIEQKKASTIQESIGAQELAQKGVGDAAAAVSLISGISKEQGGSNVYVRGLGDRYLNTTYNGLSLPSNNIENKNMDLELFSSDIIQNVSVKKAYSATLYGDFAAGNVNVLAKDYSGDFFIDADLGTGFNTRAVGKNFMKSEGTSYFGFYNRYDNNPFAVVLSHGVDPESAGEPVRLSGSISGGTSFDFGEDSEAKLSIFATASFSNNFEFRTGPQTDFSTVVRKRFSNTDTYLYNTTTTAMANVIFRANADHRISFNSLFINSANDRVEYFGTQGEGQFRDAILDTDKGFYQMNVQFGQDMVFVNQILGEHTINEQWKISWGVGYNKVFARQPDRRRISVERFDLAFDNDPNTQPSFFNNIPFDNQRYFQRVEDDELNSRLNFSYKVNDNVTLNFGHNGRMKERFFENIRYGYNFIEPNTPVEDVLNLDGIFDASNLGVIWNTRVFNAIESDNNFGNENFPGLPENTYTGELEVHAAYLTADINLGEKWLLVPGIRVESFDQQISYDVINLPPNEAGFRESYENFFLPSLNVRYALNDDANLRFSFSKTVSNPEFKEVAPFVYEDVTQRIGGNPGLLDDPSFSEIFNLDLKYEWFFKRGELLSVAAFAKQINDPINRVIANDATATQRYFRTGEKAEVLGLELEVRKKLISQETEDNEETVLSAGLNFTYMYTRQDLKESTGLFTTTFDRDEDQLQGASPLLLNADVSYSPTIKNYKPVFNLVFSYFSERIDALGSGQLGNIIQRGVPTLDLVVKNNFGEHWELNASAMNLLDPSIERVRENTAFGDVILSQFKRGINIGVQLKYKF